MTYLRLIKIMIALLTISLCAQASASTEDRYLSGNEFIIRNVDVIDGLGGRVRSKQDIHIKDGKIASIASAGQIEPVASATVVDGSGLTAMPGLIDMHTHLQGGWAGGVLPGEKYRATHDDRGVQKTLAAFLYAGVTTVLDVGNDQAFVLNARGRIERGEFISPRFFTTGQPFSQAPTGWDEIDATDSTYGVSVKVETSDLEELGKILDRYVEADIEIIKLYSGISGLAAAFLNIEARKRGITTVADLWQLNMNAAWMRMTGLDGWAHASPYIVDESSLKWMAENDRFVIATAVVGEKLSGERVKDDGDKQSFFKNPFVVDIWGEAEVKDFYDTYPAVREGFYEGPEAFYQVFNFGDLAEFRKNFLINIKAAHDAGVLVAGGSDAPGYPSVWAGETMHRELELFVMAGIDPLEAIKMCSYNAARVLKREKEFGSLQPGLSADILLVSGKPAKNISDTRNLEQVFVRGRLLDRKALLGSWDGL